MVTYSVFVDKYKAMPFVITVTVLAKPAKTNFLCDLKMTQKLYWLQLLLFFSVLCCVNCGMCEVILVCIYEMLINIHAVLFDFV